MQMAASNQNKQRKCMKIEIWPVGALIVSSVCHANAAAVAAADDDMILDIDFRISFSRNFGI